MLCWEWRKITDTCRCLRAQPRETKPIYLTWKFQTFAHVFPEFALKLSNDANGFTSGYS